MSQRSFHPLLLATSLLSLSSNGEADALKVSKVTRKFQNLQIAERGQNAYRSEKNFNLPQIHMYLVILPDGIIKLQSWPKYSSCFSENSIIMFSSTSG